MSDLLSNILEKYKKAGTLDIDRSGADGKENDFIGKHTDNVETFDGPGMKEIDAAVAAVSHAKRAPHHGYEVDGDDDVYESTDMTYADDIEELAGIEYDDEDLMLEEDQLQEDAGFFMKLIDEVVEEFYNEEADEEEKAMLDEMLATDEGYIEFVDMIFEGKMGVADEGGDDDVIDANPKVKGKKAKGDGKGESADGKDQMVKEDIERHADHKMVKAKTPDGKVVWRKVKAETEVSKRSE
jgi:hypothetical protein